MKKYHISIRMDGSHYFKVQRLAHKSDRKPSDVLRRLIDSSDRPEVRQLIIPKTEVKNYEDISSETALRQRTKG